MQWLRVSCLMPISPSQRVDQLIHFVDEVLHLSLIVAAIGPLAEVAHVVRVVAALAQVVEQAVVEIGLGDLAGLAGGSGGAVVALWDAESETHVRSIKAHTHTRGTAGR